MEVARDTAAVLVTHDGERFLRQQYESILAQTLMPAVLIVVDDDSGDRSRSILRELVRSAPIPVEIIETDGSDAPDIHSRIAANVVRGLAAAAAYDYMVLADQDDEWLVDRLRTQRTILREQSGAMLVAGDGLLIDETGRPIGGRLRDRFPVPADWSTLDAAGRARAAVRGSLVTGATAALTRELVDLMIPLPRGWLHDRWATFVAVARGGLILQAEPVINYRIHGGQVLGDRQAHVHGGQRRWRQVLGRGTGPFGAVTRASHVVNRVRPLASDPTVRAELSWRALLRSAFERA
jgi:glycosyltransferase involved in cell wall biosynthesis